MVIFFNVEEARRHLLEKGYVYTLRRKRRTGRDTARSGSYYRFEDLGEVEVEFIKKISSLEELKPYVHASGFETVEEWLKHAEEGADHLYKVTLIKSSNNKRVEMVNETRCPYCGKLIPAFEFAEHHATCEGRLKHFGKVFRGEVLDTWLEATRVKPLTEFMEEKKEEDKYRLAKELIEQLKTSEGNKKYLKLLLDKDIEQFKGWLWRTYYENPENKETITKILDILEKKEEEKEKEEYSEPEPWIVVWKLPGEDYWNQHPNWYKSEEAARRRAEKLRKEFKEKYDLDVEVRVIKLSELFKLGR